MDKSRQNAQNVVAMSDYQPETGYAAIAQVEAYWEAIRGARQLPKRSDIDPRGIEQALENAFILERIAPGIARLRIAGSHLNDLMGMEVRGMPLTAFFTPGSRASVADLLEVVFQTPAIGTLSIVSPEGPDRKRLDGRMILLPLKSDLGDVSRVLGCLVTRGEMALPPRRFEVVSQEVLEIAAGMPPVPAALPDRAPKPALPSTPSAQNAKGMAEDQAAFEPKPGKRRPPYLRLVKSDE